MTSLPANMQYAFGGAHMQHSAARDHPAPISEDGYGPVQRQFNPYAMNGGTVLAVAGEDFAVVAGDTRLSVGYEIMSRDQPKTHIMGPKSVLGCAGFHGDILTLTKTLRTRLEMYRNDHYREMSTQALAQMLSNTLYYRRFFPYYVYNILAGLDEEGKGAVYSYDPVGSYEREFYRSGGSASALIQPLLDNQLGYKNMEGAKKEPLTREKAVKLVKDVFASAAERDIYTGDAVELKIIDKDGITSETLKLRRD
eukprot:Clim_evm60s215 gene=Clim_evmTU60s215